MLRRTIAHFKSLAPLEAFPGSRSAVLSMMVPIPISGRRLQDAVSGWDRPELHRMLDQLRPGDVVTVWKLDRLSRSLKDLLTILEKIDAAGAGFRSLTEPVDTTTPAGRMMMQMIGSFSEFEREMIRERTTAGLEAARREGRIGGRRHKLETRKNLPPLIGL